MTSAVQTFTRAVDAIMEFMILLLLRTVIRFVFFGTEATNQVVGFITFVLIMAQPLALVAPSDIKPITNVMMSETHMNFVLHFLDKISDVGADSDGYCVVTESFASWYSTSWWLSNVDYFKL